MGWLVLQEFYIKPKDIYTNYGWRRMIVFLLLYETMLLKHVSWKYKSLNKQLLYESKGTLELACLLSKALLKLCLLSFNLEPIK